MMQTVVKLIRQILRDGVRRVGWPFLAGFCAGGWLLWYLWKAVE